jgi:hypothetical protein
MMKEDATGQPNQVRLVFSLVANDSEFTHFVEQRAALNERLDATRGELDEAIEACRLQATMTTLARLEGLLLQRRDLFARLAALDESFVEYLIEMRKRA